MTSRTKRLQRTYLSAEQRRQQLLDAAVEVVNAQGWRGLTMTGVAQEAGVSRQLVYEHFPDLDGLCVGLLHHLFNRMRTDTMDLIAAGGLDAEEVLQAGFKLFLDAPKKHRRALRTLVGDLDGGAKELDPAKRAVREALIGLWLPYVQRHIDPPLAAARGAIWGAMNACWGLADLCDDGELTEGQALELASAFVRPAIASRQRRLEQVR